MNGTSDYGTIKAGLTAYQNFTTDTASVYRDAPLIRFMQFDADLAGSSLDASSLMELGYCLGKLCGEAGEANEKFWKFMRDTKDPTEGTREIVLYSEDVRGSIAAELGDVLWYVAQAARCLDISLGDIGIGNLEKLRSRKARGVLGGSGDTR